MLIEPNTIQQTKLQFGHFFADGKSSKDTDTSVILGTAYRNTSFIYEQTVHGLSDSALGNRSLLETSSNHEFGTYIRFD
jgi:hypothetical protein